MSVRANHHRFAFIQKTAFCGKIKACALKLVSVLLVDGQGNEGHKDEIVQGAL